MCLPRHQADIDEIANRVGQRQYLRGYATSRASNGLAESPHSDEDALKILREIDVHMHDGLDFETMSWVFESS